MVSLESNVLIISEYYRTSLLEQWYELSTTDYNFKLNSIPLGLIITSLYVESV